jgi:hypothetical protein
MTDSNHGPRRHRTGPALTVMHVTVGPMPPAEAHGLLARRLGADRLAAERQVLQAAIVQAGTAGFDVHAWQLPWALVNFWARHGHWHDSAAAHRTRCGRPSGSATRRRRPC